MGQPTPPGDLPLIEGLGSEWNDIVSAVPEDMRADFGPKLKERVTSYTSQYEPLKQWEEFHKSGVTPEHADTALKLLTTIENNPREVYDTIGNYLKITPAQAQAVVEELQESDGSNSEIEALKQQVETLAQIALAQRQMTAQEQQAAEQDAALEKEINSIKQKYGNDVPEDEIIMRMLHKNMTAEQAYEEYSNRVSDIQKRRPSPMVMGSGGVVPTRAIDPTKLNSKETKTLVAQMLEHAKHEREQ